MSEDRKHPQQTPAFDRPDALAIRRWLLARLSKQLEISADEIDPNEPLTSYGVGSAEAVSLSGELEEWLGREVPATVAYDYPTVEGLTRYLATAAKEQSDDRVVFTETTPGYEPVAIIGVGCRFPGARDARAFWQLLRDGEDAISEVPGDRWDLGAFYDEDPRAPGRMSTRWGGFLDRVDAFDPGFFGISPREASRMDPQQRLLLEVAWEALEDAGQAADRLEGTRAGVFVGISSNDYGQLQFNDPSLGDAYAGTGNALSIAANRISYLLNLHGPSLAVDTACSSSLVATHLACQSLRQGECQVALVGGVSVILSPMITVNFTKAGFMAPDGRCKAFDARANGYVRGEGAGVVVLKPLSRALRDGDPVYAVIRGSAVNQDGRTNGITAPNGPAQSRVLREAYQMARVSPGTVQYLEAHGTGTSLGDPIEAKALGEVLAEGRVQGSCALGSVKTNIGHLEAAAGIAGLIKVALSLHHRMIPPSLHFEAPNPHIPFEDLPLHVQTNLTAWPDTPRPATAGVSSFGFGGTNAHVVLTGAPQMPDSHPAVERPVHLLCLSAKTESAVADLARNYGAFLETHSSIPAGDVCFTASAGRAHFEHRRAMVGASSAELAVKLQRLAAGKQVPGTYQGRASRSRHETQLAFLFTGQGSQYAGMGKQLYATAPVFRNALEQCAAILRTYDVPLIDLLYSELTPNTESRAPNPELHQTRYTQPALFSLEYALARLWQSWGIEPSMVLGHSVGEYAAACVAGVMDLEGGLKLIAHRGRLMQRLSEAGAMAAVFAPEDTVKEALQRYTDRASVAAINGPENIVIAGARDTIALVLQELASRGIDSKPLKVSHAFHSPMMDPVLEEFKRIAEEIPFREPKLDLVSNLTGQVVDRIDAAYWGEHLRSPVRFRTGMETLKKAGSGVFVEVGPDATLTALGQRCVEGGRWVPSLRRKRGDWQQMLAGLGQLYLCGVNVDWEAYDRPYESRKVTLPTYPFQRQRHWIEAKKRTPHPGPELHPLLGVRLRLADTHERRFEQELGTRELAWLTDHRVGGQVIFPAAGYVELALAAAGPGREIGQLKLELPLKIDGRTWLQTVVRPNAKGAGGTVETFAQAQGEESWGRHAVAQVYDADETPRPVVDIDTIRQRCIQPMAITDFYRAMSAAGLEYGATFQTIREISIGKDEILAQLSTGEAGKTSHYDLPPTLLDGAFQTLAVAFGGVELDESTLFLPVGVERVRSFMSCPATAWCHTRWHVSDTTDDLRADLSLLDEGGRRIAEVSGFAVRQTDQQSLQMVLGGRRAVTEDWLYEIQWQEQRRAREVEAADFWPPTALLGESLAPRADALLRELDLDLHQSHLSDELQELSLEYISGALIELGWCPNVAENITEDALIERLGIQPSYKKLTHRMLQLLAGAGWLKQELNTWQLLKPLDAKNPVGRQEVLLDRYPQCRVELTLLGRCGTQLARVLTGVMGPLGFLFPHEGISAEDFYRDAPGARLFNGLLQESLRVALTGLPPDRHLRILEIGAGTGGTTGYVLPILPEDRTEYTYTDVSAGFLGAAEERFVDYSFVTYRTLDIERTGLEQGFVAHRYDLVLAANVLHATRNIEDTLANVRELLAPQGLLILLEGLERQAWLDLTFGLLPGWWRFDDAVREDYALMNVEQWRSALTNQGFSDLEAIHPSGVTAQSVLIARGPSTVEQIKAPGAWLLAADTGGAAEQLAQGLSVRGHHVVLAEPGAVLTRLDDRRWRLRFDHSEDWQDLLDQLAEASAQGGLRGVVHLASFDASDAGNSSAEILRRDIAHAGASALALTQALVRCNRMATAGLWLITQRAQSVGAEPCAKIAGSTLWGMGKCIALEHPEINCRCLDIEDPTGQLDVIASELIEPDRENHIALRGQQRYVARLVRSQQVPDRLELPTDGVYRLAKGVEGTLAGLHTESLELAEPGPGEVQVEVHAAGLNFRDVLDAVGMYPGDAGPLGAEMAGIVTGVGAGVDAYRVGDAVVGFAAGCFGNRVNTPAKLLAHRPGAIRAADAAAVPIVFATAQIAFELADLMAGEKVLIHAAAGGVGLAAIQLAQSIGAEIYATASAEKQGYLRELGVLHLYDSRSTDFAEQILRDTDGAGVDVILNSLTTEGFIAASVSALAAGGHFVEIGKREIWTAKRMNATRPDVAYSILAVDRMLVEQPDRVCAVLREIMGRVEAGELHPLRRTCYPLSEAPAAMRFMQRARHIGKIVLTAPPLVGRELRRDRTYLITGGLAGIGLEVARWLAGHGARHIALNGRRAASAQAETVIAELREQGVKVHLALADVTQAEQVQRMLADVAAAMPPLIGVFHSVGVLHDGALLSQTWDSFEDVLAPKVMGSWHLHSLTAACDLDLFVLFASTAGVLGNRGQANHAAANAFLDQLARHRRALGLPAVSIDWGAWAAIGAAAEQREHIQDQLAAAGIHWIEPDQGLEALERIMVRDRSQVGVLPVDWTTFASRLPKPPPLLEELLVRVDPGRLPRASADERGMQLVEQTKFLADLDQAPSDVQRRSLVENHLRYQISRVLRMAPNELGAEGDLTSYGLDSIIAMELATEWRNHFRINLSPAEIFKRSTLTSLADYLMGELAQARNYRDEQREDLSGFAASEQPDPAPAHTKPTTDQTGPLSSGQEGLWFFDQFVPQNPVYNEARAIRISGKLDVPALTATLAEVVARHEILRTTFPAINGRPTQHLHPVAAVNLLVVNLEDLPPTKREEETGRLLQGFSENPFRLDEYPLFRTILIQPGAKESIFALSAHHIVCDGSSIEVFAKEVSALYDAFHQKKPSPLRPLPIQYRDFVHWQRMRASGQRYESHLDYWREHLSGVSLDLHLPLDHPRPAVQTFRGARFTELLSHNLTDEIRALSDAHGVVLFVTLSAAFNLLLFVYGGSSEVVVGTPIANRPRRELRDLIGFFVNTLILRTDLSGDPSFLKLLERVRDLVRDAYFHSEPSLEQLLEELRPKRDIRQITLVQAGFGLATPRPQPLELAGLKTASLEIPMATAKTDLSLLFSDAPGGLSAIFEYNSDIFSAATIQRMADTFKLLLEHIVADPSQPISHICSMAKPATPSTRLPRNLHQHSNLTGNQLLIWLAQKVLPELPVFNVATLLSVHAPVDLQIFRTAFQSLVDRTDTFRTVIHEVDDLPQQRVIDDLLYELPYVDFSTEADPESSVQAWINERARKPLRLGERTFDSALLKISDHEYTWYLNQHHTLTDGWSLWLIHHRMTELYAGIQRGESVVDASSPDFQEYVEFERSFRNSPDYLEAERYWTEITSDRPEPLEFYGKTPSGHAAPVRRVSCPLGLERSRLLRGVGRKANGSVVELYPPEILLTAFCAYLYLMSGNHRLTVGNMYHNRPHAFAETAGLFMQILPVRVDIESGETFASLARKVKQSVTENTSHGQYPVSNPLQHRAYDAVVNYLTMANGSEHGLGGAPVSFDFIHSGSALESLCMRVTQLGASGDFTADFDLRSDVFDEEDALRTTQHFLHTLDACLFDPRQRLDATELVTGEEKTQLLTGFNDTRVPLPPDQTFLGGFDTVVRHTPDRVAARCDDSVLTYASLHARADQFGAYLRHMGIGPECMVAVYMDRSIEMLVAILGVWKTGCAYVPLDPKYPTERIQFILADSGARVLVTRSVLRDTDSFPTVDAEACHLLCIDTDWEEIARHTGSVPSDASLDNLAYSIYTSGSTGKPKGVLVHHRGMFNHMLAKIQDLALSDTDVVAQTASHCFDISIWQFMAALLTGGSIQIYADQTALNPLELADELQRHGVSIFETVPSLLNTMLREARPASQLAGLRWLLVTGEALPPVLARLALSHYPNVPLVNAYGPTECSDDVTHFVMSIPPAETVTSVPIGHALANTQLFILHRGGYLAPLGSAGELYVGGLGVGRGYRNEPARTAESFLPDPFTQQAGSRLYRTGDLGRYLEDGNIEFLGRRDDQVKIRGFRVELGEIEAALGRHPGVQAAVVLAREDTAAEPNTDSKRLVAYVVTDEAMAPTIGELQRFLQETLPHYMVPSIFTILEAIPLTANGKIDRKALPAPDRAQHASESGFVAPRTAVEEELAAIWREVLGIDQVGVHDNFFTLGGDSILGIQFVSRANREGFKVDPQRLFQHQTIAGLATVVEKASPLNTEQRPVTGPVLLTPIQHWFFEHYGAEPDHFAQTLTLDWRKDVEPATLWKAIQHLLLHHDSLRLRFTQRPDGWEQFIVEPDPDAPLVLIDLSELEEPIWNRAFETAAAQLCESLSLCKGPILRVGLFRANTNELYRLSLVIHHLAVDAVSWRILIEDLLSAYEQLSQGNAVYLPPKTTSFQQWSQQLFGYAQSSDLLPELDYWTASVPADSSLLPRDFPTGINTVASARTASLCLSAEETKTLLYEVPQAYHTQINDVLLTAVVQAFSDIGLRSLWVGLESHGRTELLGNVDTTRTVGWFTSICPVHLSLAGAEGPGEQLRAIKEQLRAIPNGGLGYGLLRYLTDRGTVHQSLQMQQQPEVIFNHLGQFDRVLPEKSAFRLVQAFTGLSQRKEGHRHSLIEINSHVSEGQLRIEWTYSENIHKPTTIEALVQAFRRDLKLLMEHCTSPQAGGYTPSDFPQAQLNQKDLDRFIAKLSQSSENKVR